MATNPILLQHLTKVFKNIDEDGRLSYLADTVRNPLSTGLLCLDEFFKGGLFPGFYTFAGMPQSGKSLISITLLASAYHQKVPILVYFDAEDSINLQVASNVFKEDFTSLVKPPKSGSPRIQCLRGNSLEGTMDAITTIIRNLPDKIFLEEQQGWYYKLPKDKEGEQMLDSLNLEIDQTLAKRYPKFYLCRDNTLAPDDTAIQAVIVIDSLAILLSDREEEETSNQMGIEARLFSKHLKRFIGKLNKKRVIVIGVNQLRENPMDMYNPEYEPGGKAIEFYALVRTWLTSVSVSTAKWKAGMSGKVLQEDSALKGGKDSYMFKRFKLTKDKVAGKANTEMMTRVWVQGSQKEAGGFCPVTDVYYYLEKSGKFEGNRKLTIPSHPIFKNISLTFEDIKKFVLAETHEHILEYKNLQSELMVQHSLAEFPRLRKWCFDQLSKELAECKVVDIVSDSNSSFEEAFNEESTEETKIETY